MARQPRDYAAEYRRRIRSALARGLEKSAARGHPRPGEIGAAELRQLRRATEYWSPGGWHMEGDVLTRGPAPGPDPDRRALARRVAEIAGVDNPLLLTRRERDRGARDGSAEAFARAFMRLGLGSRQWAYTLWFSP